MRKAKTQQHAHAELHMQGEKIGQPSHPTCEYQALSMGWPSRMLSLSVPLNAQGDCDT